MNEKKQNVFLFLLPLLPLGVMVCGGLGLLSWLRLFWPGLPGPLFWLLWALPPLAFFLSGRLKRSRLKSLCRHVGEGGLGLGIYPLLLILAAELLRLLFPALPLRETGFGVLILCGVLFGFAVPGALRLRVRHYKIPCRKLAAPLRLALLSDLHLGFFTPRRMTEDLQKRTNALDPDLILLAGDIFDEDWAVLRHPEEHQSALAGLRAPLGVWACEGNHDLYCPCPEAEAFIAAAGIRMLRDESADAGGISLTGRRDIWGGERLSPEAVLAASDRSKPVLVLDHRPSGCDELVDAGADLVLCGHTHGGQTFPGNILMGLISRHFYGLRQHGDVFCIVTSGAGQWGPPIRLGVSREIVCIDWLPSADP